MTHETLIKKQKNLHPLLILRPNYEHVQNYNCQN